VSRDNYTSRSGAAVPDASKPPSETASSTDAIYLAVQSSPDFQELRTRLRRFVFPMTAFFLVWYGIYVALGAYAHDFMATPVWGNINAGLLIGLGQFLTTFVITGLYVRFANRELDPRATELRARVEAELEAAK
jgi:uncharacterized membrane protein (DUF485 family)